MSEQQRDEHRARVVHTVEYNTTSRDGDHLPEALDADHIRVPLCANGGYPGDDTNRAIADALEAGELREVEGGYVVTDDA